MSLVEQSQQSFPTSVQVTVHQARNLRSKGKNGTNDAYAIIQVAKDKFSTSVDEKSSTPVWKEEASFGLPLFHSGNVDRCTLYIIVMHRVQAGLDKFLGQAVINLVDLHQNKSRQKPDWFPLVNKTGKEDKVRGDVLLGITFLRNNMSASMVDLSMQDKPRSRMSKLKDKMRLKKKDSFSDSGSAMSHVLTDSEGDGDSISSNQTRAEKKKSKLKNLFAPKSNLQRNSSQSMSTLGTLPSKNSSLSGSRSSGINVETPEAKKKFKFLGHKRSGSSDSKVSLGALSFLSRSKRSNNDLTNPSVNSAQVNPEDPEDRSSSTISVNSSVHGSMETVPQQTTSDFEHKSRPVVLFRSDTRDRLRREDQRRQEEEEQSRFEAMRLHEEEQRQLEEENRKQSEEYERNGRFLEDEDRREKEREEEEEEQRRLEIMENEAMTQKSEAQKRQEEASMSERLSSLFGMIRKKEERKEEALYPAEEVTTQAQHDHTQDQQDFNARSSFENFSLTSSNQFNSDESPFDEPKSSLSGQTSNLHFLNRTAIVSPVKPRLTHSLESEFSEHHQLEYSDPQTLHVPVDQQCSSPSAPESPLSSLPYDSSYTFSNLHSSLTPLTLRESPTGSTSKSLTPSLRESPPGSPRETSLKSPPGSPAECWPRSPAESPPGSPSYSVDSVSSSPTMADNSGRAPLPPLYPIYESQGDRTLSPARELLNIRQKDGSPKDKKLSLPLPDYETLFPQKRHGVQGHTRWDHIIAEVNQRRIDSAPELTGPEMSVDGPGVPVEDKVSFSEESSAVGHFQTHQQESRHRSTKKTAAPPPPKQVLTMQSRSIIDSSQRESQNNGWREESLTRSLPSGTTEIVNNDKSKRDSFSNISLDESENALRPSFLSARDSSSSSERDGDSGTFAGQTKPSESTDIPTARPRQRQSMNVSTEQKHSTATSTFPDIGITQKNTGFDMSEVDKNGTQENESSSEYHPHTRTGTLSKHTGLPQKPARASDALFTRVAQREQNPENLGMTTDDLDRIFTEDKSSNSLSSLNGYDTNSREDAFRPISPVFKRQNSSKRISKPPLRSDSQKSLKSQPQEAADAQKNTKSQQELTTKNIAIDSFTHRHPADGKAQAQVFDGEHPFGSDPFAVSSTLSSSVPVPALTTETSSKLDVLSARKKPKKALLPPSVSQLVSQQISNEDEPTSVLSRPHPVQPMSTSQQKNLYLPKGTAGMVAGMANSGPFTQLTHEELITLVVRQQADLSKKDGKIGELEEYIDNLLVRVIEEKPAILQSLNAKPT
ncbi:uncharacterized protein LOC144195729 isoform X1 [Stigmatopora nigra]